MLHQTARSLVADDLTEPTLPDEVWWSRVSSGRQIVETFLGGVGVSAPESLLLSRLPKSFLGHPENSPFFGTRFTVPSNVAREESGTRWAHPREGRLESGPSTQPFLGATLIQFLPGKLVLTTTT